MSEARKSSSDDSRSTMADVSHVHRYDPGASTRFYSRGPLAFTDGGERSDASRTSNDERSESLGSERERSERDPRRAATRPDGGEHEAFDEGDDEKAETEGRAKDERQRMADVSHTPPTGDREVNRVFERGREEMDDHR